MLRGFTAFDVFLEQHPEFREKVTFIAHLQPSRQDVPEYAEYLERIEALVAVVNHRHGTTDWMPIDLRIYENFHEAVARYKHFDLLMVNSLFDGMNLVAKEAPAVNTRDGVVMLSENTGAHEELGDCTLSVNPFDIQEQADAIHRALTMEPEERALRAKRLKEIITERDPGDWVDEQLADIRAKRSPAGLAAVAQRTARSGSALEAGTRRAAGGGEYGSGRARRSGWAPERRRPTLRLRVAACRRPVGASRRCLRCGSCRRRRGSLDAPFGRSRCRVRRLPVAVGAAAGARIAAGTAPRRRRGDAGRRRRERAAARSLPRSAGRETIPAIPRQRSPRRGPRSAT